MKIDPESNFVQYAILLENMDAASRERLEADAESVFGSPWEMKLGDFFAVMEDDWSFFGANKERWYEASVRQFIWLKMFRDCEMRVGELLKSWQVPTSKEAKQASSHCLKMTPKEGVIVFTRRYFGLPNFNAAMEIPLSDFIVAKKDEFNNGLFQYYMAEQQKAKFHKK